MRSEVEAPNAAVVQLADIVKYATIDSAPAPVLRLRGLAGKVSRPTITRYLQDECFDLDGKVGECHSTRITTIKSSINSVPLIQFDVSRNR